MATALRLLSRTYGLWAALFIAMLFTGAPGAAQAATCAIDFSVNYNSTNNAHVMSMTQNFDEFSACDPRYIANPGDPASGFTPYVQNGTSANGGSFSTQVNAADDTIVYTAPTGFSGVDTFVVYFCDDAGCSFAGRRTANVSVTVGTPTIVVNPASLPNATVAAAYSQTLTGAGGNAPYGSFTVISGSLPAGLSLSAGGALTGTPTASGVFNFTIRTTDSSTGNGPFQGSRAYTLTVNAPTVVVNPTTLPAATVGAAYSQTATGAGGTAPYGSFIISAGALPAGLALATNGALTGTPTAGGSFNFTIRTTDSTTGTGPHNGSRAYTLVVNAPTITVNPTTLPAGTQGNAYSQAMSATGGTSPYSFAVTSGSLPAGLTLAPGGTLSGTPTVNGSFPITITATDSSTGTGAYTGARGYTLVINAPPAPVANAVSQTVAYNSTANAVTLNITGGAATSVATPGLPSHGTVNVVGTSITYTPTTGYAGPDSFTYTASNAGGTSAAATVTITVSPPTITVSPTTLPNGTTGVAYSQNVTAAGGSGSFTYAITSGTQPTGLTLSAAGVLSGTPSGTGPYTFTVTATDTVSTGPASPFTGARAYSVTIITPDPAIANPVSATVAYNSSNNPITLNITGGAPTSVTVSTAAGNGTATAAGTAITYTPTPGYFGPDSFAYTATNADGTSAPATVTITVNPQPPIAGAATATVAQDSTNNPITLNITGGTPTSVAASAQTNGTTSIAGTSITFTPTPGYNGPASFSYTATNAGGTSAPATVSITVNPLPPIAGAASATVAYNSSNNSITLNITGGTPASVAIGTPAGNGTATALGTSITYTPTPGYFGSDSFTYTATNAGGVSAPATVTITVNPQPPVTNAVSATVAEDSSNNPITLNITGGTPVSLAVSAEANGTATVAGTSITFTPTPGYNGPASFDYTATNAGGTSAAATVSITVTPFAPIAGAASVTVAYGSSNNPVTLNITGGAPTSVAIDTAAGNGTATAVGTAITYTPTPGYFGSDSFTYTATNGGGTSAPATVTVTVTPETPVAGAVSATVAQDSSDNPITLSITGGAPASVAVSSEVNGTATVVGTTVTFTPTPGYNGPASFSYTATNAGGTSAPATASLTVTPLPPVAGAASVTVAYGSSNNPVTLNLSGGTAASVAIGTPAGNGTATAAGTAITYTPTAGYFGPDSFTYTATNTGGTSAPATVTVTVNPEPPVASAVSATVAQDSSNNPITLSITGGAPASVSGSGAVNGSVSSAGTSITFTPTPGYNGPASFSYTATNAGGTSAPATVSITVDPLPPVTGAVSTTVAFESSNNPITLDITGGTPVSLATPSLPANGTVSIAGLSITYTPTTGYAGSDSFTYTATNTGGTSAPATVSITVSPPPPPVTGAVSATVAANSATNPITLSLTGGTAVSLATPTLPSHGTVNIAGLSITYTPTAGYSGADSFTYTATNLGGTSAPATVTVTVTAPTLTLSELLVAGGQVTVPFSQTVTATEGTTPYSFLLTAGALPTGLGVSTGGVISGTPTATGIFNFTLTATDTYGATGSKSYSLTILPPTIAITAPGAGALPSVVAYEAYSQTFTATGGQGAHSFAVTAGALPTGLTLSAAGALSGNPTTPGTYNFSVTPSDSSAAPGPYTGPAVAYSITVSAPTISFTPTTLPAETTALAVSETFTATGGTAPHAFAVTAGSLPTGITLTGAGVYAGTPSAAGTYSFSITATDANGFDVTNPYSVTVTDPLITLTAPAAGALPGVEAYNAYSQALTATGGQGAHTFAVTAGALPPGITVSGGALSGTPTTPGTYNFTLAASDSSPAPGPFTSAGVAYSITVSAPTISFTPVALPAETTAVAVSETFTATGGTAPHGFAVTAGSLPTGITLTGGGVYAGTPSAAGTYSFTVTATDANGFTAANAYTVVVSDPVITLTAPAAGALPSVEANTAYSQTFTANGGQGAHSFAVTAGGLPTGLGLTSGGVLSGSPTAPGTYNFTITASDSSPAPGPFNSAGVAYSITVTAPTVTITAPAAGALPSVLAYDTGYSQSFTASGGSGAHTFAVTAGAVPTGMSLSTGGVLSGTPTAPGTYNFSITANDSAGVPGPFASAPIAYSLTVTAPTISFTPTTLPAETTALAVSETFTATGGTAPYGFAVTAGALPTGVTLTGGGVYSGTPSAAGTYSFTVTATDANGFSAANAYTVTVADPVITLTAPAAGALPSVEANTAYSQTFTASGGQGAHSFAVTAGALPPGLTLSAGGVLSGSPTTPGTFNFTVAASDSSGAPGPFTSAPVAYSVTVTAPTVVITTPAAGALPSVLAFDTGYSQTFTASGGTGAHTFAVTAGALPTGMSLSTGGVLSGTPTAPGTYNFSVTASDSAGAPGPFSSAPVAYSLTVTAPTISFTPTTLPAETTALAVSETFAATGGTAPYGFAVTAGALPTGISLTGGGVYSGTPSAAGTYSFTVTGTDANGFSAANAYTVTVADPVITLTAPSAGALPTVEANTAYSQTFTASGGQGAHSFALTAGALPPGLTLSAGGVLSGSPTTPGTFNFTVAASDSSGAPGPFTSAPVAYSVTVTAPTVVITTPAAGALPSVLAFDTGYSQTFTASGGTGAHTFAVTAGAVPTGMSLSTGGVLSGTPTAPGTYNFSITASDSAGAPGPFSSAPVAYSVTVTAPTISFTPTTLPAETTALALSPTTFVATGGTGPYAFSLTAGSLPTGTSVSGGGVYSGAPTAAGTYNFSITATDANGFTATNAYTVVVTDPTVTITTPAGALPAAEAYVAGYSQTFTATGGQGGHSFAVTAGAIPSGMTLTTGGVLSGTPTAAGTYNFTLVASDSSGAPGPFASSGVAYNLTVTAPTITITAPAAGGLPSVTAFTAGYSQTFTATGGNGTHTFAVTAGALPPGMTLTGGALSGTPTATGIYNFTVTASDTSGAPGPYASTPVAYAIAVTAPTLTLSPATLPAETTAVAVSETFTATGGTAPHSFAITAGSLPTGVTLTGGGVYAGMPSAAGTYNFAVTASDANGFTVTTAYTVTVSDPVITLTAPAAGALPSVEANTAYSQTFTASGGQGGHSFAVTAGALPPGLGLTSGGVLSGSPTTPGTYNFTITASDGSPAPGPFTSAGVAYSIAVTAPTVVITTPAAGALPSVLAFDTGYSQTFTASGGTGAHTFAVTAGALPTGMSLSTGGVLSGTPTAPGTYNFSVTASDSAGAPGPFSSAPVAYSLTVAAPTITFTPVALPAETTALALSPTTFVASGGTGPYGFTVTAGALPTGTSVTAGGVFSGTPTAAGTYGFTVTATDANGFTAANAYTMVVSDPTITIDSPAAGALPGATGGVAYSQTFSATGGQGAHGFAVTAGALPAGISLTSAGLLSGTPTTAGTFNFSITASDSSGAPGPFTSAPVSYSLTVAAPTITFTPVALPAETTAVAVSETFTATGGTAPHSFAVTAGALPTGVTLAGGGAYSGTPTAAGTYGFTVTATDANGFTAANPYTVVVSDPAITIDSPAAGALPGATGGVAYSQTFTATGGQGAHSFALTAGALPAGMSLTSAGVLSGTPTAAGTFNFSITASDSSGAPGPFTSAPVSYSLTVAAPTITFTPVALPAETTAVAVSETFTATGGTAPHSFAVTAGALPTGVTLTAGGVLSGTPTAAGTYGFTVTATDANGFTAANAYTVVVSDPTITIDSPAAGALPGATGGVAYSQTFTATGGQGAHSFALTAGALPAGMSLTSAGVLSGTPTAAGTFNFSITASDSSGAPGPFTSAPVAYSLTVAAPTITLTPTSLPAATTALALSPTTFVASGGTGPYGFAVTAGALPPGTSLTAGGVLSGTPTAAGTYGFTVTTTDANGFTAANPYSLVVSDPTVTLTSPAPGALPSVLAFTAGYSQTFTASGGSGAHSFAVTAGALPPGMSVSSGGVLSGTPTTPGTYNFSITASDSSGAPGPFTSAPVAYSLTVTAPTIAFTPSSLPAGTATVSYAAALTASGGTGPYSFSLAAGGLPPGVSLSAGGALSGTPTTAGTFSFDVTATDTNGFTATNPYSVAIAAPTISITAPAAGALPGGLAFTAYSETFTASGGLGPHSFAVTAGALPPGISLTSAGALSGTPTAPGTYSFSVTASDGSPAPGPFTSAPVAYSLTVTAPTITFTPTTLPAATTAVAVNQSFIATGGTAPHGFTVTAGSLPTGVSLSGGGVYAGTPTAAGTYVFSITATDANGFTATNPYSVVVTDPTVTVTSPAAGALPDVQAYAAYSQTFTASGGAGGHSFAVAGGALPPGLGLSAGGVLSGTPTTPGIYNFTVTASDSSGAPGPFTSAPVAYSLTVTAPVVSITPATLPGGVTATAFLESLTAGGGTGPYSFSLTAGALPTGLALAATGSVAGTPTTAGTFGFTITATDANGFTGSTVYSVVIAPAAPVAQPDTAATPANQAVGIPVTDNDSGLITSIAVATAPSHGAVTISGLIATYTPTADYFGADSFTYTATGPGGTSTPATVSITVTPLPVPTAAAQTITAVAGQPVTINVTDGATGGPITAVAVATTPSHGTATVSGQTIVYTAAVGYSGTDSFTYTLANVFGVSAPATVTVTVNPAPVTAAPITIEILAGQTATADLTAAATGGPFTGAAIVTLAPSTAGTAAITNPAAGQYGFTFTPNNDFAGTVTATYTLSNAFATSAPGTVTVIVTARPDPSIDPEVTGLISAQDEAARRFATAQISNFNGRLESLRDGGGSGGSLQLGFSGGSRDVAEMMDPTLRRRMAELGLLDAPFGFDIIDDGGSAAGGGGGGGTSDGYGGGGGGSGKVGLWAAGMVDFGQRDAEVNQRGVKFTTDGLTAGADYRFSDTFVLGAGIGWGHDESRIGHNGTRSEADGYSFAVYGSYQPVERFFIDGVLGYGMLEFDSRRYITATGDFAYGQRDGDQWFGSITGGWDMGGRRWKLSPYGRLTATRSALDAFDETTGGPYALSYESQTVNTLTGTFGLRGAYSYKVSVGELTPRFRFEYSHDFEASDRANLSYVDWVGGPVYGVYVSPLDENRILGGLGLDLLTRGGTKFTIDYETMLGGDSQSQTIRIQLQTRF